MACYDCEYCEKHHYSGGKCKRWEYNCPFRHLQGRSKEEQEKVDEDFKLAVKMKGEFKELLDRYKFKFNDGGEYEGHPFYSEYVQPLIDSYNLLDGLTDQELAEEWNRISKE